MYAVCTLIVAVIHEYHVVTLCSAVIATFTEVIALLVWFFVL